MTTEHDNANVFMLGSTHAGAGRSNKMTVHEEVLQLQSSIQTIRSAYSAALGYEYQGDRDMYTALGYKKSLDFADYNARFKRQDLGKAVIRAPVDECWRDDPQVLEKDSEGETTEFEQSVIDLDDNVGLWAKLRRGDLVSGICQYGALFLGFGDVTGDAATAATTLATQATSDKLLFITPLTQDNAKINKSVDNPGDARFGQPELYEIKVAGGVSTSRTFIVHWSRMVHIAEDATESDIYGTPRLEAIFNRLVDSERIAGGSGEQFWRGAFPGLHADIKEDANPDTQDIDSLKEQMADYVHRMERVLRTQGIDITELSAQIASPKDAHEVNIALVSAGSGIPKRRLQGSERGELASSQDEKSWASKMETRRERHVTPNVVRATLDRLIEVGVLTEPAKGFEVTWPPLIAQTEEEKAQTDKTKTETLVMYANSAPAQMLVKAETWLKKHMGYTEEEAAEAAEQISTILDDEDAEIRARDNEGDDD